LLSKNHFAFIFGKQFLLNDHKTDVRKTNKGLFSRARLPKMDRGDESIYQQFKKGHYNKYFIELASLVRIGEIVVLFFFYRLMNRQKKNSTYIPSIRTGR